MRNKVLLVEDSRSFAVSVASAIEDAHHFPVIVAENYAQAQEMVSKHRHEIFVAITDLNLPDAMDGAAAELMAREEIPCIAFTGNFSPSLRKMVLQIGVADYVLKRDHWDIEYVVSMVWRLWKNQTTKVLVVDDQDSAREYLKLLLQKQCYQVLTASSAEQALQMIEQHDFRIVMIDLVLKGMDGFSLLDSLRRKVDITKMCLIGVSGSASSEDVARFIKYGGNDFLIKPFEQEQVTCRVNANAQLLEQFDRLSDLNQQKNELLGMAAHDIRTPLGAMVTGSSLLAHEDNLSDRGRMLVGLMSEASAQMEELLDSLLDMSAIQNAQISIEKEQFQISELIRQCEQDSQLLVENKEQSLNMTLPHEEVSVYADRTRLREVINNLISNASKYSQRHAAFEVCVVANQQHVKVQVIDEAGGIPEDEQALLFKPFAKISTTPTDGERSTGLGLSICHRIMSLLDGKLLYKANGDKGSIFELQLPRHREDA